MLPFENDFIRFFSTREKIRSLKAKEEMQKNYCRKSIDKKKSALTDQQVLEIEERWKKISFAYQMDPVWHQLYTSKTGKFSKDYIPNELHYYFTEYQLINFNYLRAFTDKNYLALLFSDIKQPKTVIRCIQGFFYMGDYTPISIDEAVSLVRENIGVDKGVVVKPSISSWGGRNISFYNGDMGVEEVRQIFSSYGKNFIVQNVLEQHKDLAAIHSDSVNTVRIITILIEGEVVLLSACLRMGVGKSQVDNFSQGGVGCGIDTEGRLRSIGYDRHGNMVKQHPNGFHFEDCIVPNFNEVVKQVKKAALRVPQFGVASWDFAVDKTGAPILIEYNVGGGSIDIHQYNNGPLYGDKTDKIIDYVFKDYHYEDATIQYNYYVYNDHVTISNGSKDMSVVWIKKEHHGLPVTRIGRRAFENSRLKLAILPKSVLHIDYCAFYNCKNLIYIRLPKGLRTIGRSSFNGCTNLKSVKLPHGMNSIGIYSFKNTGNIEIHIPATVQSIADNAFEGCQKVVIHGVKNSFAEEYAKVHNYCFCPDY